MLYGIVNTKTKAKLLKAFVERKAEMHISEAASLARVSKSRASECLKELAEGGVLETKIIGRSVVYSLAKNILAKKTIEMMRQDEKVVEGVSIDFLREAKKLKPVSIALFGSAISGLKAGSDIDFFVVSEKNEKFYEISADLTEKFGIKISVLVMNKNELRKKARRGEEFAINVLANHKLLYGKKLEDLIWQGR